MKSQIMSLIRKVFAALPGHLAIKVWQKRTAVWIGKGSSKLPATDPKRRGTGSSGKYFMFDLDTIEIFLDHLLDNKFVAFGDRLLQQLIRTPMGANCASLLAKFYLAMYEHALLQNLADVHANPDTAVDKKLQVSNILAGFGMTGRFIDDLLTVNNPYIQHILYTTQTPYYPDIQGLYPDNLLLEPVHADTAAPYMDITIRPAGRTERHRLTTVLYDKRLHPPMSKVRIVKYPDMSSNISNTSKYNIITSQLHRMRRIILARPDFVENMANVIIAPECS